MGVENLLCQMIPAEVALLLVSPRFNWRPAMKRAFVTGASGFLGAALVQRLIAEGVSVAVLQRGKEPGRRLHAWLDRVEILAAPQNSPESLRAGLLRWRPDTVFHLGWGGVGGSQRNDALVQCANVENAVQLATLCVKCGVEHFLGVGSQAEYGPRAEEIFETQCPSPTTMYGAAKLSAGILTERLCELGGVKHSWLRLFSAYGPDDNPDWMIPSLIRHLGKGLRPALTQGEQLWDYLYVDDAAAAFAAVAKARISGLYNLGSGAAIPLRGVIEQIRDSINPALELGFGEIPYRPDQVMHLQANIDKLKAGAAWAPATPLQTGLSATIEWFSSPHD